MDKEISKKRRVSIIWKRVVSLLVIVAMMVCYVPSDMFGIENISVVEAATTYNASAAAIYGQTYTNASGGTDVGSYNKQYKYYQGNDCANFVSQCLVAGGLQTDGTWYAYSRAWIRADYLLEWFRAKSEYKNLIVRNPSPSEVKRGDPLFYVWGTEVSGKVPNDIDHAGICTAVDGNGNPLVSAHSSNRKNYSAWRMGAGAVYVVKLHELDQSSGAVGEMTTPSITTNRNCYGIGETINISWNKTSSQTDFLHYWMIIYNTDTGKECFGGATGSNGDVNANSYQFSIPEAGHYCIDIYAVPYNDKEHRQKKASKTVWTYDYDSQNVNLGDDFYASIVNTANKKCLTADSDDNVTIRTATNASNQSWHFIRQSNGSYEIVNKASGKALDDYNWGQTNGTNVGVYTRNNATAQRWFIRGTTDAYFFNAACGSAVIDITGNASADGTNVEMYEKNNSDAQKFTIKKQSGGLAKCNMTNMQTIQGGYKLSWEVVTGATKYEVYRKKSTDTNYAKIATVQGNSTNTYNDTGCVSGNVYLYKVKALDNNSAGDWGKGYYTLYLDSPHLTVSEWSKESISMSWNRVTGADSYYIYSYNWSNDTYTKVKEVAGGATTSCTISGLDADTHYKYIVRAHGTAQYNDKTTKNVSYMSNSVDVWTDLDQTYNGLIEEDGEYHYYVDGVWQTDYTGLVKHTDDEWYYVKYGTVQSLYTGLAKHTSGTWYYIKSGKKQGNYTGLVKWNNTWWYIRSGAMAGNYTGLAKHSTGSWYYIKNGRMQGNYTGLVKHTTGSWYYVKNGKMQNTYTGLVKHTTGSWYYVKNGKVQNNYSGLVKYTNGKLYYIKKGIKYSQYTGFTQYSDKKIYYVRNGVVVDSSLKEVRQYLDNTKSSPYIVITLKNGYIDSSFNGRIIVDDKYEFVKAGNVLPVKSSGLKELNGYHGDTYVYFYYDSIEQALENKDCPGYIINGEGNKYYLAYSQENIFSWMYGQIFVSGNELYYYKRFYAQPCTTDPFYDCIWQVGE